MEVSKHHSFPYRINLLVGFILIASFMLNSSSIIFEYLLDDRVEYFVLEESDSYEDSEEKEIEELCEEQNSPFCSSELNSHYQLPITGSHDNRKAKMITMSIHTPPPELA